MARDKKKRYVSLFPLLREKFQEYTEKELYSRILCGEVRVDGGIIRDPKADVRPDCHVEFMGDRYVSRGGEKLEAAISHFQLDLTDKVLLDAGSSTGGFTHCLLLHGAKKVHSVDVGYNQLSYTLRNDPRVVVHERTNVMSLQTLDPPPHGAVADLSFRSIAGAASLILSLTLEGWLVALIKPQFEWKDPPEDFDGIIRDSSVIKRILGEVSMLLEDDGVYLHGAVPSPITGRKGNREYLFLLKRIPGPNPQDILKTLKFS